jgi:hypothetical protein
MQSDAVGAGTPCEHAFEAAIAGDGAFKIERAFKKRTRPHGLKSMARGGAFPEAAAFLRR